MYRSLRFVLVGVLLAPIIASGEIPLQINHQGLVRVDGVRFNGNGDFRFALVDQETGEYLWTNDGSLVSTPDPPTDPVNLLVINGIYNIPLGDTDAANMQAISTEVFTNDNVALRIWFDDKKGNAIQQLTPDHVLTSAPYAFRVHDGVTLSEDQTITGDKAFTGLTTIAHLTEPSQVGDIFFQGKEEVDSLAPGKTGQVLRSQGAGSSPVWGAIGVGGAWQYVETLTLSGNVASSSTLPTDSDFFAMFFYNAQAADGALLLRFNGDNGANYEYTSLVGGVIIGHTGPKITAIQLVGDGTNGIFGTVMFARTPMGSRHAVAINTASICGGCKKALHGLYKNGSNITSFSVHADANLSGKVDVFKLATQ